MSAITTLSRGDFINIRRDSLMQFLLIYPVILGLVIRWLIPWITAGLMDTFDLTPYHLLLASFFGLIIMPDLAGSLIGLLLLDERDENTLTALLVTPMPITSYVLYRVITPTLISLVGILVLVPLIGIDVPSMDQLLVVAISASLGAPIFTLLLASLAKNKVEGIAVMKGMGVLLMAPMIAWFVPQPWQWLLGLFPTFWSAKAYWLAVAGESYLWVAAVGGVYAVGIVWVLLRRFQNGLYK
ncbi:MAG: ABC transporter [Chloroflexi bacterium]|nr:ABC transporter [Chloroflexota bacterium]